MVKNKVTLLVIDYTSSSDTYLQHCLPSLWALGAGVSGLGS